VRINTLDIRIKDVTNIKEFKGENILIAIDITRIKVTNMESMARREMAHKK
jgi:hypothetical protein